MDTTTVFYTVDALLGSVVYALGLSRVLPMRYPLVFGIVFVVTVTLLNGIGFYFVDVWVGVVLIFAVQGVLPFLLFEGSAPVRTIVVLAAWLCETCSLFVLYAVLAITTGQPVPEDEGPFVQLAVSHIPEYAIASLVSWLVLLVLLHFVSKAARRFAGIEGDRFSWTYVAFAMTHMPLMLVMAIIVVMLDASTQFVLVALAACALCVAADMLIFSSMDRAVRTGKDDEKARLLGASLDACLEQCDAFVSEVERTAAMRHDVRNQAQAALALAEQGDFARAREHLSSFRSSCLPEDSEPGRAGTSRCV